MGFRPMSFILFNCLRKYFTQFFKQKFLNALTTINGDNSAYEKIKQPQELEFSLKIKHN